MPAVPAVPGERFDAAPDPAAPPTLLYPVPRPAFPWAGIPCRFVLVPLRAPFFMPVPGALDYMFPPPFLFSVLLLRRAGRAGLFSVLFSVLAVGGGTSAWTGGWHPCPLRLLFLSQAMPPPLPAPRLAYSQKGKKRSPTLPTIPYPRQQRCRWRLTRTRPCPFKTLVNLCRRQWFHTSIGSQHPRCKGTHASSLDNPPPSFGKCQCPYFFTPLHSWFFVVVSLLCARPVLYLGAPRCHISSAFLAADGGAKA